jgi:hypothetical protein
MERRNLDILSAVILASGLLLVFAAVMCRMVPSIATDGNSPGANGSKGNHRNYETNNNANSTRPVTVENSQDSNATNPSATHESTEANHKDGQEQGGLNHISIVLVIANVVMALGTWVLAVFAMAQALIAQKTAKRQLRAYVHFERAKPIDLRVSNGGVPLVLAVRNSGQTPAYKLRCVSQKINFGISHDPNAPNQVVQKTLNLQKDLGASRKTTLHLKLLPLTNEQKRLLDTERLWLEFKFEYQDIFNKRHHFCFLLMYFYPPKGGDYFFGLHRSESD